MVLFSNFSDIKTKLIPQTGTDLSEKQQHLRASLHFVKFWLKLLSPVHLTEATSAAPLYYCHGINAP